MPNLPPSWIFHIWFKKIFLMVGRLTDVELHYCAKFGQNRSNRGRDMAIFRFFQDGGRPPSWICCVCSDHPRRAFGGLYCYAKFGWNWCNSFDNMHVFGFREFGLKTPIHASKFGFWGYFTPKWGAISIKPKKAHPCASPRRLSHHARKSVDASDL